MSGSVQLACRPEVVELTLARVLPMRLLDAGIVRTAKYRCIEASVRELGLVEPLVVYCPLGFCFTTGARSSDDANHLRPGRCDASPGTGT
jgi:hypothetical protein